MPKKIRSAVGVPQFRHVNPLISLQNHVRNVALLFILQSSAAADLWSGGRFQGTLGRSFAIMQKLLKSDNPMCQICGQMKKGSSFFLQCIVYNFCAEIQGAETEVK